MDDFDFVAEFAAFADYVGAQDLHKATRKVMHKLSMLDAAPRRLFGTRYFFHEQMEQFTDGPQPFYLDTSEQEQFVPPRSLQQQTAPGLQCPIWRQFASVG